jgi:hypothetical protein
MGHLQSKEEIAQAPGSVVVQARTKDGVPIQDSEVDASKPELVAQQAAVLAQRHPEAAIEVKPTEQVIKERLAAQPEKKAAKGDVVKFTDRAGVERTGTVKHVNDMAARIEAEDGSKHEIAPSKINSVVPNTVPGNSDTDVTELKKKYGIGVDTEKAAKEFHEITHDDAELEKRYDALGKAQLRCRRPREGTRAGVGQRARPRRGGRSYSRSSFQRRLPLFNRKLDKLPQGAGVTLITGPVAAGKTKLSAKAPADLTYEVNLSNFAKASEHIDNILKHGDKPHILYVYNTAKGSAVRRAKRMMNDGRPVSISKSTPQHLELPQTIEKLAAKYGDKLRISIFDNSKHGEAPTEVPVADVERLKYTGSEDELLREQQAELDRLHAGTTSPSEFSKLSHDEQHKQIVEQGLENLRRSAEQMRRTRTAPDGNFS